MNRNDAIALVARILLAQLFFISAVQKIGAYTATQAGMDSMGIPGGLLPLVIALEIGGAAALVLGFLTRWIALALGAFSIAAAVLFHFDLANPAEAINFMKNFSIAGGFLMLYLHGPGAFSVDMTKFGKGMARILQ